MKVNASTLYICDNGHCYCGDHLGTTARFTGRDISGQEIMPITPDALREAEAMGWTPTCEEPRCGRTPSLLHTV